MGAKTIGSGDVGSVNIGLTDIGDVVNGGGTLDVYGQAISTTINANGLEMVSIIGVAIGTQVIGGMQIDYGTVYDTSLTGGPTDIAKQYVEGKAVAYNTVIDQFAFQEIDSNAFAYNSTIHARGWQDIMNGAYAEDTFIDGGVQYVEKDGWSDYTKMFGGTEIVKNGGTSEETEVNGANMFSRGDLEVLAGGWAQDAIIDAYGVDDVYGIDHNATVAGEQIVHSGGSTLDTTIDHYGLQQVQAGAVAADTKITSHGTMIVQGGGTADVVTFAGANGLLDIGAGASVIDTIYGFGASDQIDLRNIQFAPGLKESFTENGAHTGGVLMVTDGTTSDYFNLHGQYTTGNFGLSIGQGGSTLVTGH